MIRPSAAKLTHRSNVAYRQDVDTVSGGSQNGKKEDGGDE